jgi:hypothetical protein
MRILLEVLDRSIVRTRAPSEPMLSVAACELLNSDKATYIKAVATLTDLLVVRKVIIEPGKQGELFVRLLLTLARDWATCLHDKPKEPEDPQDFETGRPRSYVENGDSYRVRMVTLRELLEALLGEDKVKEQEGLAEYTEAVYVNFTHFHQLRGVLYDVSSDYLRNAWERGVAFQVTHNQDVIDGMIVTYSGSLTEPWDNSKLGTFCYQVKFKKQAAEQKILDHLVGPTVDHKRPEREVVMLMDLGTTATFQGTRTYVSSAYAEVVPPANIYWGGYRAEVERKRWCIAVRGNTAKTYPVLSAFEPKISQTLGSALPSDQTRAKFKELLDTFENHLDSGLEPTQTE